MNKSRKSLINKKIVKYLIFFNHLNRFKTPYNFYRIKHQITLRKKIYKMYKEKETYL